MKRFEYLDRLENYHQQDVSWHKKNNSDIHTLQDELIELGDEDFVEYIIANYLLTNKTK